jgi:hypothetical protein
MVLIDEFIKFASSRNFDLDKELSNLQPVPFELKQIYIIDFLSLKININSKTIHIARIKKKAATYDNL